jgi:peroxiredoxin Q/BCP
MLKVGDKAPEINLPTQDGKTIKLAELKGKKVVLYFYPKDDTPGCTKEACAFNDTKGDFEKAGAVIYGVSFDSAERHNKFRTKYGLGFDLLVDAEKMLANAYGVYKEKKLYGKVSMGIERTTFVIDTAGKIAKIYPKVKVDGHIAEVLEFVKGL